MAGKPGLILSAESVPAELRALPQWVLWRYEERDGKRTKIPYRTAGRCAESDESETWTKWDIAKRVFTADQSIGGETWDGVGFVFAAGGGLVGVDLDHCIENDGTMAAWAVPIVDLFGDTYAEVSPSGTGIKFWARGSLPTERTGTRRSTLDAVKLPAGAAVEMYQRGRYFTVTGQRWGTASLHIRDCAAGLATLWTRINAGVSDAATKPTNSTVAHVPITLDDEALLDKIRTAKKNGDKFKLLESGDWKAAGYLSWSEADQALANMLAFWTGGDPARIDRLFRRTGLVREKWIERDDYRTDTITKAIEGCGGEFYTPKGERRRRKRASAVATLVAKATSSTPSTTTDPRPLTDPDGRTDAANAARLAAQFGGVLRWCEAWQSWLVWDGCRWARDMTRKSEALAKTVAAQYWDTIAQIAANPSEANIDAGTIDTMMAFAKSSNNANGIRNMLALAKSEPGIAIVPEVLDVDPWLLNVANGTLDLRTRELRPHNQADYLTKISPVAFDPAATCPSWLTFLESITDGKADLIPFLARGVGYSLSGVVRDHALMFCYGTGSNGKSTFITAILDVLGEDYAMKTAPDMLMAKKSDAHPTERADLHGKRFVACVEAGEGRRMAESLVKELTGGDKVRARRMREDFWEFKASHKVWLAANHKPIVRGTDHGIWRRIKLVPFTVCIPDEKQDRSLGEKLRAEASGILNWALAGCLDWQANGLAEPEEVRAATTGYRAEMDTLGGFLMECCIESNTVRARSKDIYCAYQKWTGESGEHQVTKREFGLSMTERGFQRVESNGVWYLGVGILPKYLPQTKTEGSEGSEGNLPFPPHTRTRTHAHTHTHAHEDINPKKGSDGSYPSNDRKQASTGDSDDENWAEFLGPSEPWN